MIIQHKCPSCGADMLFDAQTGLLHCESCGHDEEIATMENQTANQKNANSDEFTNSQANSYDDFVSQITHNTYQNEDAQQFHCQNCGAILITNTDTTATKCSYCDSPMIIGSRLVGELAPSKVAPFSISKEAAELAFKKWCGKSFLLPTEFKKANRLKSITGIYVPFWLFDIHSKGEIHAECTKVKHHVSGDYNVKETSYYDVYRKMDLHFKKIPVDASEKMNDTLMDQLEPFDYSNLHDFNTPYLSGYLAEKYDYTDEQLFPRVKKRALNYAENHILSTIEGYNAKHVLHKNILCRQEAALYTLLPVWMFCYDYQNTEHNFMMNGQTGKIVGKPPISIYKCILLFGIVSLISFILIHIICLFIGGV